MTNARKSSKTISAKTTRKIEEWNKSDVLLYRHFNQTLFEKINEIGVDVVESEKAELEKLMQKLTDECVEGYADNSQLDPEFQVYKQPGVKVLGIKVKPFYRFSRYLSKLAQLWFLQGYLLEKCNEPY